MDADKRILFWWTPAQSKEDNSDASLELHRKDKQQYMVCAASGPRGLWASQESITYSYE